MPDGFHIDASEFDVLRVDFGRAEQATIEYAIAGLEVTAGKVRDDWRENAGGLAHAPQFPGSITYDFVGMAVGGGVAGAFFGGSGSYNVEIEIGPDKDRPQGALGNLIEFGSVNNPPMGLGHGALQRNEADFEYGASRAVDDGFNEAGL